MSLATKLTQLASIKDSIKTAINNKGGNITAATPFADYAEAITNIQTGDGIPVTDVAKLFDGTATSLDLSNTGITKIRSDAFYDCSALQTIILPESITSIGGYAFYNCKNLTSITIPAGVTNIANYTFQSCSALKSINLGNTAITSIGTAAFWSCYNLTSITIPASVTSIGSSAFYGTRCNLYFKSTIPPTLAGSTSIYSSDKVYVPTGYKSAYQSAQYYPSTIYEMDIADMPD